MPLEKRSEQPPKSNDELLEMAERYCEWSRRNYGKEDDGNEYAMVAANIAQAAAAIVIARSLSAPQPPITREPGMGVWVSRPTGLGNNEYFKRTDLPDELTAQSIHERTNALAGQIAALLAEDGVIPRVEGREE